MFRKLLIFITLFTISFGLTACKDDEPEGKPDIDHQYTDALEMDFTYEGSNFVSSGIGEVTLDRCVDGDTAIFKEGSTLFSVRFLGINTPESTAKFEPWGKAASEYTCDKLTNAQTIVLEHDAASERTDGNDRYLSYVWYDGRLLNLELIEEAYTGSKGVSGLKYQNVFYDADFKTQDTDRRIWGEDDPDFDYSLEGERVSIEELVKNQSEYEGKKVVVLGTISRTVDGHPYLQNGEYGIYLYKGFTYTTKLAEGNEVLISGLTLTYYPDSQTGAAQLTDFNKRKVEVISEGNVVNPVEVELTDIDVNRVGSLVTIKGLEITDIYANSFDDAFTLTCEDSLGNTITIRRDKSISDVDSNLFNVGNTIDITGPVSRYMGNYQIMLVSVDDVVIK